MNKRFQISRLGLGTVQFGMDYGFGRRLAQPQVDEILMLAQSAGLNFLDTAPAYGDSEDVVGRYCQNNPGQFTVATKLSPIDRETAKSASGIRERLAFSMDRSKKALGQTKLPLLLMHQTDDYILQEPLFWGEVAKLKKECMGTLFGLSVYDVEPTRRLLEKHADLIDCIQAPCNVVDTRFEVLEKILDATGIVFIARSVLLKGALVEECLPEELKGLEGVRNALKRIASDLGVSVSQLLIRFVLDQKFVDCVLIGVHSAQQLKDNIKYQDQAFEYSKYKHELEAMSKVEPFLIDPRRWKSI